MKVRVKFSKHGVMKFIGHLDIMRYFQKAIRRAEIPICFTEGFSPHMIMSFASPLGVGLTSDGEYMDIEVKESIPSKEAVERLNRVMVEGMKVISYRADSGWESEQCHVPGGLCRLYCDIPRGEGTCPGLEGKAGGLCSAALSYDNKKNKKK